MMRRIFVVEDYPLMRRSLIESLEREPDLTVCGQAEDAAEAQTAIVSLQPDLVLTDIHLKSSSGLDLIKSLQSQTPPIPVIATTMFDARRIERLARDAGAWAFISKQNGPEALIALIREVLEAVNNQKDWPV